MGSSNLLVAMKYSIVEFKIRVFVESLRQLSPKESRWCRWDSEIRNG